MNTDERNAVLSSWQLKWNDFIISLYETYQIRHNSVL